MTSWSDLYTGSAVGLRVKARVSQWAMMGVGVMGKRKKEEKEERNIAGWFGWRAGMGSK